MRNKSAHLHCRTGRFEALIWEGGKQVYLGGFDNEEQAGLAYDLAALKFRGDDATLNFARGNYASELLDFYKVKQKLSHASGTRIQ